MGLSRFQTRVLAFLGIIAFVVFGLVIGAAGYIVIDWSSAEIEPVNAQSTSAAPQITNTPKPTVTPFSLPTAKPSSTPLPTNTPVVAYLPTESKPAKNEISLNDFLALTSRNLRTNTPTPRPTPTIGSVRRTTSQISRGSSPSQPVQRGDPSVRFWADKETVSYGGCTTVRWHASSVLAYWVNGEPGAGDDGSFRTCPKNDEKHHLKVEMKTDRGSKIVRDYYVKIRVNDIPSSNPPQTNAPSSSSGHIYDNYLQGQHVSITRDEDEILVISFGISGVDDSGCYYSTTDKAYNIPIIGNRFSGSGRNTTFFGTIGRDSASGTATFTIRVASNNPRCPSRIYKTINWRAE